jgi:hypothetical protein
MMEDSGIVVIVSAAVLGVFWGVIVGVSVFSGVGVELAKGSNWLNEAWQPAASSKPSHKTIMYWRIDFLFLLPKPIIAPVNKPTTRIIPLNGMLTINIGVTTRLFSFSEASRKNGHFDEERGEIFYSHS